MFEWIYDHFINSMRFVLTILDGMLAISIIYGLKGK